MTKWWHVIATIGLAALAAAVQPIQQAISGHLVVTGILGVVWSVLGSILPSPLPPTTGK